VREFTTWLHDKWGDIVGALVLFVGIGIAVWGALAANEKLFLLGSGTLIPLGSAWLKLKSGVPASGAAAPPNGEAPK